MCYRISSKDIDKARESAVEISRSVDQQFIAAAEVAQQADKAAFARFVARLAQWRADLAHKSEESVS